MIVMIRGDDSDDIRSDDSTRENSDVNSDGEQAICARGAAWWKPITPWAVASQARRGAGAAALAAPCPIPLPREGFGVFALARHPGSATRIQ